MNVYIQELKMSAKSFIYGTIGMIAVLILFMLMFPVLSRDAALMQEVFSKFPPEILKAFGINVFDLSTITGFYGFLFTYIILIGSIYSMKSGLSVLSEEVRSRTADFLVTKPISRNAIVTAKIMSSITTLIIQNVTFIICAFIVAGIVSQEVFDKKVFFLISISLLLVQLFFMAFGLLLSVIMKRVKTVMPITMGIVFGFFVLQLLNQSLDDAKLAYLTPFAYFDSTSILKTGVLKGQFLALDLMLICIFIILTYVLYNKKDVPSV